MEEIPGISQVLRLASVDSTQKVGRKLAQEGAPEWTLVWAESQTAGRGRLGRRWSSGPGGLYISLILRPKMAPKRLAELSLITADTLARVVNDVTGLKTAVKPPNDVLAQAPIPGGAVSSQTEAFRKVCGILLEATGGANSVEWVVLGVGLNVNNHIPKTLPGAASLSSLTGREFDLEELLRTTIQAFQRRYQAFLTASNGHIERPAVPPPPESAG
ncbi:MAG: biotin--[acetyl-CoA-carboxylase] ligase [Elusimicrobia bacterium]|nr:biotin--[acetyl-CoA-carboxylase] ligase [Elusimicrobiota bacterium]